MSLEPIQFQKNDSQDITEKISVISNIKNIIFTETGVKVQIKKYDPPKLTITVDNSPAASEINSQSNVLTSLLQDYNITNIKITTH